jgi:hypothetical protein
MEIKLHSLLAEVQELKNKAREMEEENIRLRKELAAIYRRAWWKEQTAGKPYCTGDSLTCSGYMTMNSISATFISVEKGAGTVFSAWLF